ncbi:MAG TPA: hypothetical protein VIC71_10325 [Gammaproteobacteria bacterium]|jgi:hypothetical protein
MSVLYDLHDAARQLWKTPMLALAVFTILAAGIGLNVAASNLVDSLHAPDGANISLGPEQKSTPAP